MYRSQTVVEHEAEKYAREYFTNEVRQRAFIDGALWLTRKLWNMTDHGAMAEAMRKLAIEAALERSEYYPEDIFVPTPKGTPYKTPDGAAAAMARFTCNRLIEELAKLGK